MKKKTAPQKVTAKKTVKRTIPHSASRSSGGQAILFRRIVIISACLVLFVGVVGTLNKGSVEKAVAGVTIMNGVFDQATVPLPVVPNAVSLNVYYRQVGSTTFTNAVRNIPPDAHYYIISYLKKNTNYEYRYAAVDKYGKEFLFSDVKPLTDLGSM